MSYLSDLLGDAYKEGMTEEEISTALQSAGAGAKDNEAEVNRLKAQLSKANSEAADYKKQLRGKQSEDERCFQYGYLHRLCFYSNLSDALPTWRTWRSVRTESNDG